MGATQSKPRFRRSRRFSSLRKRQGPEGANDPEPLMEGKLDPYTPRYGQINSGNNHATSHVYIPEKVCKPCMEAEEMCRSVAKKETHREETGDVSCGQCRGIRLDPENKINRKGILAHPGLKVDLPPANNHFRRCEHCFKSKNQLGPSSQTNRSKLSDKEEHEWTITLYEIDKLSGKVPQEDLVRLMSSIYDAVDNKVWEAPHGRKTVRVRLSVTPEPGQKTNGVNRSSSGRRDPTLIRQDRPCQHSDCPKTEPTARKLRSTQIGQSRDDDSPRKVQGSKPNEHRKTPNDRYIKHICGHHEQTKWSPGSPLLQTNGVERRELTCCLKTPSSEPDSRLKPEKRTHPREDSFRRHADAQKSSRTPKREDSKTGRQGTKRRPRYVDNDPRTVMLRTRKKDPRFASPYDQHFQEAMYLRLRELQRQGSYDGRRTSGQVGASDEADEDSVGSDDDTRRKRSSTPPIELITPPNECYEESVQNGNSKQAGTQVNSVDEKEPHTVATVHYHHHYHHGLPPDSRLPSICNDASENCVSPTHASPPHTHSSEAQSWATDTKHRHFHHHYHNKDNFPLSTGS